MIRASSFHADASALRKNWRVDVWLIAITSFLDPVQHFPIKKNEILQKTHDALKPAEFHHLSGDE